MSFGDRLRDARLAKGYTQEQLASMIGVAKSTLTGYEKGNREPDVVKIKSLVDILEISSDHLLGLSGKEKAPGISSEDKYEKYADVFDMLEQLPDEQRIEVRGYIKHLVYEHQAAEAAKQINGAG